MSSDVLYVYRDVPCEQILSSLEDERRPRLQAPSAVLFENCIPVHDASHPPRRTKQYRQKLNSVVDDSVYESVTITTRRVKPIPFRPPNTQNLSIVWDYCVRYACSTQESYFVDEGPGSAFMEEKLFKFGENLFSRSSEQIQMEGKNSNFFYYVTSGSHTPLHVEDFNLDSLNIHLFGEPKLVLLIHECVRQTSLRKLLGTSFQTEDNVFDFKRAIVITERFKR